jgi:hypothetical protein
VKFALTETIKTPGRHCFFGYYDRAQSIDGDNFICIVTQDEYAEGAVKIYNRQSKKFKTVLETSAISFQLGNLTSWITYDKIACHIKRDNKISAVVIDVNSGDIIREYDRSIYTVSYNQLALMFHVENAGRDRPAYGLGVGASEYRGVTIRNLFNDTVIAELSEELIDNTLGPEHGFYPEHGVFLSETEVVLLLRTSSIQTGCKREILCIYNFNSETLSQISELKKISHFNCIDGNLIAFGSKSKIASFNYIKSIAKNIPLLDKLRRNKKFRDSVISEQYWIKGHKWISVDFRDDGHPTPFKNGFIFDTYEDENNNRHLYFYDFSEDLLEKIDTIPSDFRTDSTPQRCDLHPRAFNNGFTVDIKIYDYRECLIYEAQNSKY